MVSSGLFRVTEYECSRLNSEEIIAVYESQPMCLRDAGRFAAALSYARGAYIEVEPVSMEETYHEWWYAGTICRETSAPPVRMGKRLRSDCSDQPEIKSRKSIGPNRKNEVA